MDELEVQQKSFDLRQYWDIVVRRRWWILGSIFAGFLLVLASTWVIPLQYTSQSVIAVQQQAVPQQLVSPNVQVDLSQRLQAIKQQVLSRPRLLSIINSLHLYKNKNSPDDQAAAMLKDISIDLLTATPTGNSRIGTLTGFVLSYTASSPQIAQAVNSRLDSFFVDENVRASQQQSQTTTQFLQSQVDAAGQALSVQADKLRAFKSQYLGELPEQLASNQQILQGLQNQLQNAMEARDRAVQQQTYLSSLATQYASFGDLSAVAAGAPPTINQQIDSLKAQLTDLESKYTPDHPDVKKLKDQIAALEKMKADYEKAAAAGDKGAASAADLRDMAPILQIQSQLKSNKLEIADRTETIKRLQAMVSEYQHRLNMTPIREQQLADLSRSYTQSQKDYNDLLAKSQESSLATELQKQSGGEQFNVVDPPSLPDKPSFPNRFYFALAGLGAGIVLAGLLAFGIEFLDDRVRTTNDVVNASALPILIEVPPLPTEQEVAAARWKPWIALAAALALAIIIPVSVAWAFVTSM